MRRLTENEIEEITDIAIECWENVIRQIGSREVSLSNLVLVLLEVNKNLAKQYLDEIEELNRIENSGIVGTWETEYEEQGCSKA
jgi:hypothetical protein